MNNNKDTDFSLSSGSLFGKRESEGFKSHPPHLKKGKPVSRFILGDVFDLV